MSKPMVDFCSPNRQKFFCSEEEAWKDLAVVLFFSSGLITS